MYDVPRHRGKVPDADDVALRSGRGRRFRNDGPALDETALAQAAASMHSSEDFMDYVFHSRYHCSKTRLACHPMS